MSNATNTLHPVTKVPALLDFDGPGDKVKLGIGRAGWTLFEFQTATEAAAFVAANPASAMPCWRRFDTVDGELFLSR